MTTLQWVCFEVFRRSNSISFILDRSVTYCNHTPGQYILSQETDNCLFLSRKMRMINLSGRYVARPDRTSDPWIRSQNLSRCYATQLQCIHEPPRDKTKQIAFSPSEDQPSPIRVFAVRMKKHWVLPSCWGYRNEPRSQVSMWLMQKVL